LSVSFIIGTLDIPKNAKWMTKASTIAGGDEHNSGPGSTLDKLHCPRGLSLTPSQAILIADTLNHRIIKCNQVEKIGQRMVGKNKPGRRHNMLCAPTNVIFHKQSKSYIICDYQNRRVMQWYRGRGARARILIENIACFGIAVDDEGYIYVSDTEKHEIRRYTIRGRRSTVVAGGDGQGGHSHQLNHPTYIFVGLDKSVYVSDSWNNRVMKWKKGAKVGVIVAGGNGKGKDPTQLDCPAGLAVDQLGTVYVVDQWNHRVMRWRNGASEGDVIVDNRYLSRDDADQLNGPEGLLFDQDGNLYVADAYNHRVQRFAIEAH
jgi:sugar lactone lactonase YvrE